jgi:HEAT repeat protein
MPKSSFKINKLVRLSFVILLFAAIGSNSLVDVRAQRAKESSIGAISIQTRPTTNGTTVTLSADTPLIRTQTWKDSEGFHIVLPNAWESRMNKTPRGVEVSQAGRSLEILVRTRPQATVRVQPLFNRLTLFVSGGLDTSRRETFAQATLQAPCNLRIDGLGLNVPLPCVKLEQLDTAALAPVQPPPTPQPEQAAIATSTEVAVAVPASADAVGTTPQMDTSAKYFPSPNFGAAAGEAAQKSGETAIAAATQSNAAAQAYSTNVPTIAYDDESDLPQTKIEVQDAGGGGFFAVVFSSESAVAFLGSGMLILFVFRQRSLTRNQDGETKNTSAVRAVKGGEEEPKVSDSARDVKRPAGRQPAKPTKGNQPQTLGMNPLELTLDGAQVIPAVSSTAASASSLFGEAQIKQEVSMWVKGLPYRADVVSSRAPNDRRVVEASLVEALNAPDLNGDDRARARQALEDNGFVLRRGAALLSASEVAVRAAAARALAEMNSSASVPFLLEALNDTEATVRTEVLSSIGAMKISAAIGALLEMSFHYPDTPASLLGDVLSACSFENGNEFKRWKPADRHNGAVEQSKEIASVADARELVPFTDVEALPESLDDKNLAVALAQLTDAHAEVRVSAARALGQFRVWSSIRALTSIVSSDKSAGARAAAVTSLGNINHVDVFAHLLIAFSDEAREVRAAAARSLSRLSVDRSLALVRLLELEDETIARAVARACIKTGMVSKAVDKLTNPDRRQSYEAFLLLSLLVKANETQAISDAARRCQDSETRLAALRLFGLPELSALTPETLPEMTSEPSPELPLELSTKSPHKSPPQVRAESPNPSPERGIMPLYAPKPVQS